MESEFDKEIDVLLRQAVRRGDLASENAAAATAHLDADEINAFAEHLLTGKAQTRAVEHFADCSRCRNILSNLVDFNAAPESEILHAEKKIPRATPVTPWYKKLFSFPQVAYAMGALALVFGGIIAVIVLRTSTQKNASEVAQMDEREKTQYPSAGMPAATPLSSMSANSVANVSNSAMSAANTSVSSATSANSNASMAAAPRPENKPGQAANSAMANSAASPVEKSDEAAKPAAPKPAPPANEAEAKKEKTADMITVQPPAAAIRNNSTTVDGNLTDQQAEIVQNQMQNQSRMTPDTKSGGNLPVNGRSTRNLQMAKRAESGGGAVASDAKDKAESSATKTIGGKNFRRADGVWYDVNYKNQKTTNVSRGSADFKKLDANIRSIADNLGGVVVIVSGGKAYRIQ